VHWPCRVVPTLLIARYHRHEHCFPCPPPHHHRSNSKLATRPLLAGYEGSYVFSSIDTHQLNMEGPLSPGDANGVPRAPSPTPPTIDPQIIVDYLEKVLEVNLGAVERDLHAPGSLLSDDKRTNTLQRCAQFSKENQLVLYVVKERSPEASIVGLDGTDGKRRRKLPTSMLTLNRRLAPLHLLCFARTHRLPSLRSIRCPSEAPDTHRLFDTP
jgi:hypothetical protein